MRRVFEKLVEMLSELEYPNEGQDSVGGGDG